MTLDSSMYRTSKFTFHDYQKPIDLFKNVRQELELKNKEQFNTGKEQQCWRILLWLMKTR